MTRWVIVAVLACALVGCGLTMTRGPGSTPPGQRPVCTESMRAPQMDAIPAALGFFTLLIGLLFVKADDNTTVGVPLLVGGSAVMVGSYVSGGVGYVRVKHCREAVDAFQRSQPASARF